MSALYVKRRQNGVVLIIGLIMLILLTILGVTGAQHSLFEEKMAGNVRDRNLAFEAAEAALLGGEDFIKTSVISTGAFDDDGTDGLYDNSIEDIWKVADWMNQGGNDNDVITYAEIDATHKVNTSPQYVIQHYGSVVSNTDKLNLDNYGQGTGAGEVEMFRVTARGTGGSDDAAVVLQTTFGKRL